jgi:hypothetical protein
LPEDTSLQREYARYRIERAKEDLDAVLVFDNFDSSKHSGVIAEFRKKYIKEGIFPVEVSKMIGSAFTIRSASDYDDMFVASKSETEEQIKNAEYIYNMLSSYIKTKTE